MTQFHELKVTSVQKTIRDAVVVSLEPTDTADFSFVQGQYLTLKHEFDGIELRRSYSICSGVEDGVLQVGIKRVSGGAFSTWANTDLAEGDVIQAMPPMGNFYAKPAEDSPHYLGFAVGSGITPILSIIKTALTTEPDARFTLVYGNRNPNTIMFREDLEDLKNQHLGRFNVIHILNDDSQEIDLFRGRIDAGKCQALFDAWIDIQTVDMAYICGPEGMMTSVSEALQQTGLAKDRIRFELFASSQQGRLPTPVADAREMEGGIEARVTMGGETRSLLIPEQTSLLDAALGGNLDAPYACKAGVCSTCKCKVVEGDVEMVANHALEDYEVEAGFVLSCQAYPTSAKKIIFDFDEAGH
ncbi:2Fe-2S iron-sulfur cluster-binding protein [Cognatishimia sp.]|uniref:2Fe-2S iron-sulfur cluster-binding protein n=1 Tax=Cognatishimia sp. TaxID=2211648 RepID=UPI00351538D0